jgi:hypothetical protein
MCVIYVFFFLFFTLSFGIGIAVIPRPLQSAEKVGEAGRDGRRNRQLGTAKRKDGKVDFFFGDGGRKEGRRGNQTVETTNCVRQSEFSRLLGGVSGDSKPNSKYS